VTAPESIEALVEGLRGQGYIADRRLATAIFLALRLGRPLFLEGEAGVGKTEVAKALSTLLGKRLVRLQCYEGLDVHSAVYEWNYARQLLEIRLLEAAGSHGGDRRDRKPDAGDVFGREFLLRRPLLEAIDPPDGVPPVLLVDELDRADEELEAFLLEVLSDFQISIPEIGTVRAAAPPVVVVTSNRTREIHDALKRRCLYHWIDYPGLELEVEIVRARIPGAPADLTRQAAGFVQELRRMDLYKPPGVAETLDWVNALAALDRDALDGTVIDDTLGVLLKYQDDLELVRREGIAGALERTRTAEAAVG
jgi:MoxR-like ATPase